MMASEFIRNPHLEGNAFFWQAGKVGALLIHGYTASTAEVRPLGEYLHARGYTVSAPLLPGHNTSPDDLNRQRWQNWTTAVERAYQDLKMQCDRVFVCGESMGGLLTLYLASEHPEIAGLVLYAPALRVANHDATMRKARLLHRFIPHVKKQDREPSDADTRWRGYTVNPVPALVQLGNLQKQVRQRLPHIHQPILIVQGRRDQSIDLQSGEIILREIGSTQKEIHWFDKSTHCVILDCEWERAAEMTLKFIKRNSQ